METKLLTLILLFFGFIFAILFRIEMVERKPNEFKMYLCLVSSCICFGIVAYIYVLY